MIFMSHNPYFNRWFSAIVTYHAITGRNDVTILILIDGFLQSIRYLIDILMVKIVTILILIDGFLQYNNISPIECDCIVTILILIDGFLQYKELKANREAIKKSQSLF